MASIRITGARARAGWLATTLTLAAALVFSSLSNYRAARAAVETLNLGQAEILTTAVRTADPRRGSEISTGTLQEILDAQAEAGLRYIALLDGNGAVSASVGEPLETVALPPGLRTGGRFTGPILVPAGDRIRAFLARPGRGPTVVFRRGDQDEAGGRGRPGPSDPFFLLLEFEPVPATSVVSRALRGLVLSGLAAALLTLVALGFWRVSRRYESAQREMELQRRLSQLGQVSAVLAHEIRNPLASLKGNAQLLAESLVDDRKKRRADRVVAEAVRLETLTTDLLDFARNSDVVRSPTDPGALLRSVAAELAPDQVELETENAPASWSLDAAQIRRALGNLIRNAAQISPAGRPPVATVTVEAGDLVFTIRDFGPGVDLNERGRIFEPFFTTRTKGTGLGLPVAKRAIELHGGTISVRNHPDGGAVFRVVIPETA